MTDTEITIALAWLEGWKRDFNGDDEEPEWYWIPPNEPDGNGEPPRYLHDANAVIPLLEKTFLAWHVTRSWGGSSSDEKPSGWHIWQGENPVWPESYSSDAPTFCRAACEALLKAHGLWQQSSDVSQ